MSDSARSALRIVLHAVFCVGIILFFGNFCTLRTADCRHIYKEYLSGLAVLAIVYLNKFVIFPRYYVRRKYYKYALWTFTSVLGAFLFEMLLVGNDIFTVLSTKSVLFNAFVYLFFEGFYIFLRDLSFATVTFAFLAMLFYMKKNQDKDISLFNEFSIIETRTCDKNATVSFVSVDDIAYCKQEQNYTYLYLVNGEKRFRYGTLREMATILCNKYALQVSRNIIVVYKNISSYNNSMVVVNLLPQNVVLPFSKNYSNGACELIFQHTGKKEAPPATEGTVDTQSKSKKKTIGANQNGQMQNAILEFIANHPGCSATAIKKNRSISQSTVNRILAQLKSQGLIEYTGSKKNGGYKVIGEPKL